MELPFAVETTREDNPRGSALQHSDSSLVTASSQGSFMDSGHLDGPLIPNTPEDVVLPCNDNRQGLHSPRISGSVPSHHDEPEVIDFTYVNVSEDDAEDVGIMLERGELDIQPETQRGDILAVLLSGIQNHGNDDLLIKTERANAAATKATESKKAGNLLAALDHHSSAARLYRENAVAIKDKNATLANTLLLLSQAQAKSALSLKSIVKLSAAELKQIFPSYDSDSKAGNLSAAMTSEDRLRAAVRGALGSRHPHEADISDSQFLGRATSDPVREKGQAESRTSVDKSTKQDADEEEKGTLLWEGQDGSHNAVDEMMELERELRDMDMALELGNSISSLDARNQNRMKNSVIDGSFMVVPGSDSYMSSSMWGNSNPAQRATNRHVPPQNANVKARNRVQTIQTTQRHAHPPQQIPTAPPPKTTNGLESSWWGNASAASQVLSSSIVSLGGPSGAGDMQMGQPANTKQLMRLMDSLKILGDENAALLREVEEAESARAEAKAAREEMKKFRQEYAVKMSKLKAVLENYAKDYPNRAAEQDHPIFSSEFHKNSASVDQLQRQEQLIRKLTADLKKEKEALKKEKEESRKKDQALRKYETFYREVKARSAQKAAQKTQQQKQHKAPRKPSITK